MNFYDRNAFAWKNMCVKYGWIFYSNIYNFVIGPYGTFLGRRQERNKDFEQNGSKHFAVSICS
jgi:hypothetical protein